MYLLFSIAIGLFAVALYAGFLRDVDDTAIIYLCVVINMMISLLTLGVLTWH